MSCREGVKAYELTEADSQVVREKRASNGNTPDDSQLIADEREGQIDDIDDGRWPANRQDEMMSVEGIMSE